MSAEPDQTTAPPGARRRTWVAILPFAVVLVIGGFLFVGLSLSPRDIPSALIGKSAPEFALPPIPERPPGLTSADLKGEVSLVNVFASWCVACRVEHPLLMRLSERGTVPIHGLNYKDRPDAALRWLQRFGDPYGRVGSDQNGRVGIDFGVYGVPETFLIDTEGRIACKHIGPIMDRDLEEKLLPAIEALRRGEAAAC